MVRGIRDRVFPDSLVAGLSPSLYKSGTVSVGIGKYIGHTHCALMLSTQRRGWSYSEGVICNVCFLYSEGVIL